MAREIKRNKTRLEKLIMETWYETNKGNLISTEEQRIIVEAIKQMLRHFEMQDYLEGSRHIEIITKIYLFARYEKEAQYSKKKKKIVDKTRIGFSEEVFVSERTLERYTNKYIKCFERNLNSPKQ